MGHLLLCCLMCKASSFVLLPKGITGLVVVFGQLYSTSRTSIALSFCLLLVTLFDTCIYYTAGLMGCFPVLQLASLVLQRQATQPQDPYSNNWLERLRKIRRMKTLVDKPEDRADSPTNSKTTDDFTQYV